MEDKEKTGTGDVEVEFKVDYVIGGTPCTRDIGHVWPEYDPEARWAEIKE